LGNGRGGRLDQGNVNVNGEWARLRQLLRVSVCESGAAGVLGVYHGKRATRGGRGTPFTAPHFNPRGVPRKNGDMIRKHRKTQRPQRCFLEKIRFLAVFPHKKRSARPAGKKMLDGASGYRDVPPMAWGGGVRVKKGEGMSPGARTPGGKNFPGPHRQHCVGGGHHNPEKRQNWAVAESKRPTPNQRADIKKHRTTPGGRARRQGEGRGNKTRWSGGGTTPFKRGRAQI